MVHFEFVTKYWEATPSLEEVIKLLLEGRLHLLYIHRGEFNNYTKTSEFTSDLSYNLIEIEISDNIIYKIDLEFSPFSFDNTPLITPYFVNDEYYHYRTIYIPLIRRYGFAEASIERFYEYADYMKKCLSENIVDDSYTVDGVSVWLRTPLFYDAICVCDDKEKRVLFAIASLDAVVGSATDFYYPGTGKIATHIPSYAYHNDGSHFLYVEYEETYPF